MEEQLNYWAVTGIQFSAPSSLTALMDDRLDKLTEMALRVLQTCAILGKNSTIPRLSAILQYPEHAFLSAIEELGQSRMLATQEDSHRGRKIIVFFVGMTCCRCRLYSGCPNMDCSCCISYRDNA